MTVRHVVLRHRRSTVALAVTAVAAGALLHGSPGVSAATAFGTPVALPQSAGLGEPSLAMDSAGRLFVTAPQILGNITGGGSPVWTSSDGGATWPNPVAPVGDPVSGGDTDLTVDSADNVFQTDLWLGNSALAVSTDHGQSFVANEYGHVQPGDDRPWLAYAKTANVLYLAYDGVDGVHVAHTLPLASPLLGLSTPFDVIAVPESAIASPLIAGLPLRECVCPPGGIAVDQVSGSVYVSYSRQNGGGVGGGIGVARSDDGGITWTQMNIPDAGSSGSAFDSEWNFAPVKVDSLGNVYVAWGESQNVKQDNAGNNIASGGVAIRYSWSSDHGATWHAPVTLSTTTSTNVFPTMDVVSPGVVDIAWYGSSATGDPNLVPAAASWDLVFTQVTGATSTPVFTPSVAVSGIHKGCVQSGGFAGCSDRTLLDFFQLVVDHQGLADVIYTAGQASTGSTLFFVHQTSAATATGTTGGGTTGKHKGGKGGKTATGAATAAATQRPTWHPFRTF